MNETQSKSDETSSQVESILEALNAQALACYSNYTGFRTFKAQPTDVFIVSWMKSGTTFLQQLIYQLLAATGRVPTDPEGKQFNDISEVVPFIEPRDATGIRESINPYQPRAWKSHSEFEVFKGEEFQKCKFIYCVRDGLRVASSFFDFVIDWVLDKPVQDDDLRKVVYRKFFIANFLGLTRLPDGTLHRSDGPISNWFTHVRGFIDAPLKEVLFFIYEDAIADVESTVRRIAKFLSIPVTDETVSSVARKCSREAMAKDKRFNDTTISNMMGWNINGGVRVRTEGASSLKDFRLPESSLELYNQMFQEAFGVKEYSELAEQLRKRNIA